MKPKYPVLVALAALILVFGAMAAFQDKPNKVVGSASIYNWPMLGHDAAHNSHSNSSAPDNDNVLWSYKPDLKGNAEFDIRGLVFENNVLYFTFGRLVYAINSLDKKVLWTVDFGEETDGLTVSDAKVFAVAGKTLRVLDAETKNSLWDYSTGGDITAPVIENNVVYFGSKDSHLYAVGTDGTFIWKHKTYGEIHSVPAIANGRVCFGSENPDFSVYCLNATTGSVLWRHTFYRKEGVAGGMFHAPPAIYGNLVLIGEEGGDRGIRISGAKITPSPSKFYAFDADTGNIAWDFVASDWIVTVPAVAYGKVYFSTKWAGDVYALNVSDGRLVWKSKGNSAPVVANGKVFVGSADEIYSYDADNGRLVWSHTTGDVPEHLIIGGERLYAGFTGENTIQNQIIAFGSR